MKIGDSTRDRWTLWEICFNMSICPRGAKFLAQRWIETKGRPAQWVGSSWRPPAHALIMQDVAIDARP